jgi:hypothetical protein
MTLYCEGQKGTFVSINGGDYVNYPPGTDVTITPWTRTYTFMIYKSRAVNPCKTSSLLYRFTSANTWTQLFREDRDNSYLTDEELEATMGLSFLTDSNYAPLSVGHAWTTQTYSENYCGALHRLYRIMADGQTIDQPFLEFPPVIFSRTYTVYELKITTP